MKFLAATLAAAVALGASAARAEETAPAAAPVAGPAAPPASAAEAAPAAPAPAPPSETATPAPAVAPAAPAATQDPVWTRSRKAEDAAGQVRGPADFPLKLGGYFWLDSGELRRRNAQPADPDSNIDFMQGRFVVASEFQQTVGPVYARARVELTGFANDTEAFTLWRTQDAYVKVGAKRWDVQIGRFLQEELYYRGRGIDLYSPEEAGALGLPPMYRLGFGYYSGLGAAAVRVMPWDFLKLEVSAPFGQAIEQNYRAVRPVLVYEQFGLKAVVGAEYYGQSAQKFEADKVYFRRTGWGASLQYRHRWFAAGVNYAAGSEERNTIEEIIDTAKSFEKWNGGAWADVFLREFTLGAGFHHVDEQNRRGENNTGNQGFAALQWYTPLPGLSLKAVYGFGWAHPMSIDSHSDWINVQNSFRLRVRYDFM